MPDKNNPPLISIDPLYATPGSIVNVTVALTEIPTADQYIDLSTNRSVFSDLPASITLGPNQLSQVISVNVLSTVDLGMYTITGRNGNAATMSMGCIVATVSTD